MIKYKPGDLVYLTDPIAKAFFHTNRNILPFGYINTESSTCVGVYRVNFVGAEDSFYYYGCDFIPVYIYEK